MEVCQSEFVRRRHNSAISWDRQRLIPGWDQEAIEQTVVVVLTAPGWTPLSELLIVGAAAMGCQSVACDVKTSEFTLPRNGREWSFFDGNEHDLGLPIHFCAASEVGHPDFPEGDTLVIVDATMTPIGYALGIHLGAKMGADAVVFVARDGDRWRVIAGPPASIASGLATMLDLSACVPRVSPAAALLVAGIMLEAVRLAALDLPGDVPLPLPLSFQVACLDEPRQVFREAVLVGAGGIGAAAALALHKLVGQLHVYDHDITDPSNRARAPWLVNGQPKVAALAACLGPRVVPHFERITEPNIFDRHPDAEFVFAAVDNVSSRQVLSQSVVNRWTPDRPTLMVNTGCSPEGALAHLVGGPRKAACISCRRALAEGAGQPQSCSAAPMASVIHTNWIAAGLGVAFLETMLLHGKVPPLKVFYECNSPSRFLSRHDATCECFGKGW